VGPDASSGEIRRAFRRLARESHPDLKPGDAGAAEQFRLVSEAYRVLSDPTERASADRSMGHVSVATAPTGGTGSVFQEAGRRWVEDGQDVVAVAHIDMVRSIDGGRVDVTVQGPVACGACMGGGFDPDGPAVVCWTCSGSGTVTFRNRLGESTGVCLTCGGEGRQAKDRCVGCSGKGTVTGTRIVAIDMPVAVDDDDTIMVRGGGGPGGRGGRDGDLYVVVRIDPHPVFERHGLDLLMSLPVSFAEAVLGVAVDIPVFGTDVNVVVPPGTQGGTIIVIPGAGITDAAGTTGSLGVEIQIAVPSEPTTSLEELERVSVVSGHDRRKELLDRMR
jgi:molecular chaperone DnaJ